MNRSPEGNLPQTVKWMRGGSLRIAVIALVSLSMERPSWSCGELSGKLPLSEIWKKDGSLDSGFTPATLPSQGQPA